MKRIVALDAVIGDRVRTLRLTRGLSQDELAVLIEASADDVEKFETGSKAKIATWLPEGHDSDSWRCGCAD